MISPVSWSSELPDENGAIAGDLASTLLPIRIEPVKTSHVQALIELFERNCVLEVGKNFDPFPLTAEQARRIALEACLDAYFVARMETELVGMSMLRGFDEGFEVPSFGIFIDYHHHGQGIGRRLTSWTVGEAGRRGCSSIRLSVYASNTAALRLYRSLGFEEQGREAVARVTGKDEKIVMTKSLRD